MSTFVKRSAPAIAREIGLAAILAAGFLAHRGAAAETTPQRLDSISGQWELSLDETNRKCRLALRIEPTRAGAHILSMPYGCRKAFSLLADAQGWTLASDGQVEFLSTDGVALLRFAADSTDRLTAHGPDYAVYRLTATRALAASETLDRGSTEPAKVAAKAAPPAALLRPGDLSGRYAILREAGRDTGCMLTLDEKTPSQGGSKAFLAPACRDQGIVVFDPVGWRIARGRLVLTARKGHSTELDLQPDGTWQKDPKDGRSLGLKKL
jgi:hypothetical protein